MYVLNVCISINFSIFISLFSCIPCLLESLHRAAQIFPARWFNAVWGVDCALMLEGISLEKKDRKENLWQRRVDQCCLPKTMKSNLLEIFLFV